MNVKESTEMTTKKRKERKGISVCGCWLTSVRTQITENGEQGYVNVST